MSSKLLRFVCSTAAVFAINGAAVAAPVYVDFSDGLGLSAGTLGGDADGVDGLTWNVIADETDLGSSNSTIIPLFDATGASSGYSMALQTGPLSAERGLGLDFNGSPEPWAVNEATGDWMRITTQDGVLALRLKFAGLDVAKAYQFQLIAASSVNNDFLYRAVHKLNGVSADGVANEFQSHNTSDILTWSNIAPDANGVLELTITGYNPDTPGGDKTSFLVLNAISLDEVPEPASISLAVLGGLLMMSRRQR